MIEQDNSPANEDYEGGDTGSARQRAIEAYDSAREKAVDTLGEAPLIALAGGIAAGALIAALLPRTRTETQLVRPSARRIRQSASAAYRAAKDTGSERLEELGLTREKGEQTIHSLFQSITDAARASGKAALDAARNKD
jgi:hypothetical protein